MPPTATRRLIAVRDTRSLTQIAEDTAAREADRQKCLRSAGALANDQFFSRRKPR